MSDRLSPEHRSRNMSRIGSKDTGPELVVRRLLHRMGYRFAVHVHALPGRPDIVFKARRKVVFVHGCFWHQHDEATCRHNRKPKSNTGYWHPKLERNRVRDRAHLDKLTAENWKALTVWACELSDECSLLTRLQGFLGPRRGSPIR